MTVIALTMKVYSIWNPLRIFHHVFKMYGQASFCIDGNIENGKIRVTKFDRVLVTFRLLVMCFLVYLNVVKDYSLIKTNSFIIDKTNHLAKVFLVTNVFLSSLNFNLRRNQIWGIFNQLYTFDKQVRILIFLSNIASICLTKYFNR